MQDGCWGCFDEAQSLNKKALSVLLDHVQSIFQAMRARQSYMYLVDGTEVGHSRESKKYHYVISRMLIIMLKKIYAWESFLALGGSEQWVKLFLLIAFLKNIIYCTWIKPDFHNDCESLMNKKTRSVVNCLLLLIVKLLKKTFE